MRILDVSRNFTIKNDGGSVVSRRNSDLLSKVALEIDNLFVPIPSFLLRIKNFLLLQSYGLTNMVSQSFDNLLNDNKYDFIFFDGSTYGGLVKKANKKGIRSICFFHNVERKYYKDKARLTKSLLDRFIIPYIVYNERKSVRYSDYIITLNERDSDELMTAYGRSADFIWPTSFPSAEINGSIASNEPYLLFVGTNFFANVEAVRFIIEKLSSQSKFPIKIVGSVCDYFKCRLMPENVEFVGKVDDLAPWYRGAIAMLLPILSGSGLKTKTIEALSYGKYIIGSPEAFEGIDIKSYPDAGVICSEVSDYIKEISSLKVRRCHTASLGLFNSNFSHMVAFKNLRNFIGSIY